MFLCSGVRSFSAVSACITKYDNGSYIYICILIRLITKEREKFV